MTEAQAHHQGCGGVEHVVPPGHLQGDPCPRALALRERERRRRAGQVDVGHPPVVVGSLPDGEGDQVVLPRGLQQRRGRRDRRRTRRACRAAPSCGRSPRRPRGRPPRSPRRRGDRRRRWSRRPREVDRRGTRRRSRPPPPRTGRRCRRRRCDPSRPAPRRSRTSGPHRRPAAPWSASRWSWSCRACRPRRPRPCPAIVDFRPAERGRIRRPRARPSITSGLSSWAAVVTTSVSASPTCAASYPRWTGTPSSRKGGQERRVLVVAAGDRDALPAP